MENQITQKMFRYVELSKKFQKHENELFKTDTNTTSGFLSCSGNMVIGNTTLTINGREIKIGEDNVLRASDKLPITRAEKILAQAKLDAIFADEYDEYIKLQKYLIDYFKSLENLTK